MDAPERLIPDSLRWFTASDVALFKFVISQREEVLEVEEIVTQYGISPSRVILMPQGTTPTELRERSPWITDECVRAGYRFSTRLHIILWGDERGR